MSEAIAAVFEWVNALGDGVGDAEQTLGILEKVDEVLGVLGHRASVEDDIKSLAASIDAARVDKNFTQADAIRADLIARRLQSPNHPRRHHRRKAPGVATRCSPGSPRTGQHYVRVTKSSAAL